MPMRPPHICRCGHKVAHGQRCACVRKRAAESDKARPTSRQRGYDTAYQHAAAAFLKTHPTCTCGQPAVLVRHRISIRLRPDLRMDRSNWLPGCRSCNAKDVHRERREAGGGRQLPPKGPGPSGVHRARLARIGDFEENSR